MAGKRRSAVFNNQNSWDHDIVIKRECRRLKKLGYSVEREYEIPLEQKLHKIIIDIRAVRDTEELLIEVGTLCHSNGDRLPLLKRLRPTAKIIHIHQWKNYNITDSKCHSLFLEKELCKGWKKDLEKLYEL